MDEGTIKELKRLRAKWRREATLSNKASQNPEARESYRERCYGEANVYEMCANELDRLIRKASQ